MDVTTHWSIRAHQHDSWGPKGRGPTRDGSVDFEEVGLVPQHFGRLGKDEDGLQSPIERGEEERGVSHSSSTQGPPVLIPPSSPSLLDASRRGSDTHLVIRESSLAVEVVLEERNVRFCSRLVAVELLVGGAQEGRRLHFLHDALLRAHLSIPHARVSSCAGGRSPREWSPRGEEGKVTHSRAVVLDVHGKVDGGDDGVAPVADLGHGGLGLLPARG
jgi:hypothetical protein